MTLHEMLAEARDRLVRAGIRADEAAIDVDVYACTILGWDRARLIADRRQPAPASLEPTFSAWVARREQREPTAYITGIKEFWGLTLAVSPAVLIPRPESELIIEEALPLISSAPGVRLADVGTGSGCLAIALAHERPNVSVTATDISAEAVAVAEANAQRHGVADRIRCVCTSFLDGIDGPFDLIVANPPYVKDGDLPALSRQVAGYEPHVALFGGTDGLHAVAHVLDAAATRLVPGGWLVMEFGLGQDDGVSALVHAHPAFNLARVRADLQGILRTAVIRRV